MLVEQLDLKLDSEVTAGEIKIGDLFLTQNCILMRVKPVSWMLNSTLIQDKLAGGYIFAVDMEIGKLCCVKNNTKVEPVHGKLSWSK